ncbi:hypothetical protein GCM10009632_40570 [Mycolicibacterium alvei]
MGIRWLGVWRMSFPRCVIPVPRTRGTARTRNREKHMSAVDKAKNKAEELAGKAKEKVGQATGDRDTEVEGRKDQAKGNIKQAGEKVKDVFKD